MTKMAISPDISKEKSSCWIARILPGALFLPSYFENLKHLLVQNSSAQVSRRVRGRRLRTTSWNWLPIKMIRAIPSKKRLRYIGSQRLSTTALLSVMTSYLKGIYDVYLDSSGGVLFRIIYIIISCSAFSNSSRNPEICGVITLL